MATVYVHEKGSDTPHVFKDADYELDGDRLSIYRKGKAIAQFNSSKELEKWYAED